MLQLKKKCNEKQTMVGTPVVAPPFGRWRQKDQEFKVTLSYRTISWPAWAPGDLAPELGKQGSRDFCEFEKSLPYILKSQPCQGCIARSCPKEKKEGREGRKGRREKGRKTERKEREEEREGMKERKKRSLSFRVKV